MKIKSIELNNFRTFKDFKLSFKDHYNAISGQNNAGKSNLIKALKIFFEFRDAVFPFSEIDNNIYFQRDYPRWLDDGQVPHEKISIKLSLEICDDTDKNLIKFVKTITRSSEECQIITLDIKLDYEFRKKSSCIVHCNGIKLDKFIGREIYNRIINGNCFYLHNSTQQLPPFFHSKQMKMFIESSSTLEDFRKAQNIFAKSLKNIAKKNKEEISSLIGRLKDKYKVDVSILTPDIEDLTYALSLGDKSYSTPISEWGSGTQNQTNILLALLRAHKNALEGSTPIMVIEEPESFLHASAQADFGKILMDLADEFKIQIITTTHNIFMLNSKDPESNILLQRDKESKLSRYTEIAATDNKNWMQPFASILGLSNSVFDPWADLVFSNNKNIILVEGENDKKYFEYFKNPKHGKNKLIFDGDICPYYGTGFFSHLELLKFILSKFDKVIITYDLDSKQEIEKKIKSLCTDKKIHSIPIGKSQPDCDNIEGLLPDWVTEKVAQHDPGLLNKLNSSNKKTREFAQCEMKRLKCEFFIENANPNNEDCKEFYRVINKINNNLKKKNS